MMLKKNAVSSSFKFAVLSLNLHLLLNLPIAARYASIEIIVAVLRSYLGLVAGQLDVRNVFRPSQIDVCNVFRPSQIDVCNVFRPEQMDVRNVFRTRSIVLDRKPAG